MSNKFPETGTLVGIGGCTPLKLDTVVEAALLLAKFVEKFPFTKNLCWFGWKFPTFGFNDEADDKKSALLVLSITLGFVCWWCCCNIGGVKGKEFDEINWAEIDSIEPSVVEGWRNGSVKYWWWPADFVFAEKECGVEVLGF